MPTMNAALGLSQLKYQYKNKKITKKGIVEPAYKWAVGNNYN